MDVVVPDKLKRGSEIRVIATSDSLKEEDKPKLDEAKKLFEQLGLKVSFGKHLFDDDGNLGTASITKRLEDLHDAFADSTVNAVWTATGGHNLNQILDGIDYDLIRNHPKIVCGYSDITALLNAIYAKTGLITYYGPNFRSAIHGEWREYNLNYIKKCLFEDGPFEVRPSNVWHDIAYANDKKQVKTLKNDGYWPINTGKVKGTFIGGNMCTFGLIQGTEYMPDIENKILFLEEITLFGDQDEAEFDRNLTSVTQLHGFEKVKGLVIGRFQSGSKISRQNLEQIIRTNYKLEGLPVLANVDFGHTEPKAIVPLGGEVQLSVEEKQCKLKVIKH